ncbi:GNAT family N-acetyltransferase [Kineococcus gypseus]|uniref:GNAT family N-acetyltransferase n=1 Tax=Kineococcus gypseus TaxID=1637102 RepID=UPI003D7CF39D
MSATPPSSTAGTAPPTDGLTVVDNAELSRYEGRVDGRLAAVAVYSRAPRFVVFSHTEVLPGFEGRGAASAVVRGALDDVRARGTTAVALCPFVARWIARHPEYADVVHVPATRVPGDDD